MKSSRMDYRRAVDWSAAKDPHAAGNVIMGLLSRRTNPVRRREIEQWFFATPSKHIAATLDRLVEQGSIFSGGSSLSRNRRVLHYWVAPEWN